MLYSHNDINNNNTGWFCRFRYERVYSFLASVHGDTRRETQFLKAYANNTMLTPPQRAAHLVVFKISIHLCRSKSEKLNHTPQRKKNQLGPQRSNTQLSSSTVKIQLTSFQNPQVLKAISCGHDVIHTPAPFPVWGFIMTMVIVICARA